MWKTSYVAILNWNTKEKVIFFKIFSNFGPAQPGPSILNLAQARPGPKANIGLGPWLGQAMISMAHFRPGPKNFGPNSSLFDIKKWILFELQITTFGYFRIVSSNGYCNPKSGCVNTFNCYYICSLFKLSRSILAPFTHTTW